MDLSNMHIAQLNIGRLVADVGDVRVAEFVDNSMNTNALQHFKITAPMTHSFEKVSA